MITPNEINRILAEKKFKQKNLSFGFDAGIVGLGVGQKVKPKTSKKVKIIK